MHQVSVRIKTLRHCFAPMVSTMRAHRQRLLLPQLYPTESQRDARPPGHGQHSAHLALPTALRGRRLATEHVPRVTGRATEVREGRKEEWRGSEEELRVDGGRGSRRIATSSHKAAKRRGQWTGGSGALDYLLYISSESPARARPRPRPLLPRY